MKIKIVAFLLLSFAMACSYGKTEGKTDLPVLSDKKTRKPQSACPSCNDSPYTEEFQRGLLMKSCVEAICPHSEFSIAKTLDKIQELTATADPTFDHEIFPLVRAIANEDAYDKISRSNILSAWIKTAPILKKPSGIRLFNLFTALGKFSKFQFKPADGKIIIDSQSSRDAFPELNDQEYTTRVKVAQKILEAFAEKEFADTDPARVQLVYGSKFKTKVNETIASYVQLQKSIESDADLVFLTKLQIYKDMVNPEKLKAQFSSDHINPDALQNLNKTSSVLKLFASLSTDGEFKKLLDSAPIDIKQVATKLDTENILKNNISEQKNVLNGTSLAFTKKCKTAFSIAKKVLPSQKELDGFKIKIENIKANFIGKTKGLTCEAAAKPYQDQISTLTPNFPLSWEQFLINMKTSLNRGLEKTKKSNTENLEIDNSPNKDIFYAIGIASTTAGDEKNQSIADQICDNFMTNIFPDATYFLSSSFVTGPLAIKFPEAEGISYHTLGHWFYYFMKNNPDCNKSSFEKTSSCLLSNHSEISNPENEAARFESEDWADLISANLDDKSQNFACLFAKKLRIEEYLELSLKNLDSFDNHSSDLFRLLHLTYLKTGRIPTQCEQALAARGEKANFKNCLEK